MTPPGVDRHPPFSPDHAPEPEQAVAKKRPWPVRILIWAIPVVAAAALVSYTVPGAHPLAAATACLARYATAAQVIRPASSSWTPYGSTQISDTASSLAVRPDPFMGAADEWFGASLPVTASCDYRIEFQATLVGPLFNVPGSGFGYAIGAHGSVDNGVPDATTIQFDPPFGGLRTVDVPGEANAIGHNPSRSLASVLASPTAGASSSPAARWWLRWTAEPVHR
jgi:hypothetical protein